MDQGLFLVPSSTLTQQTYIASRLYKMSACVLTLLNVLKLKRETPFQSGQNLRIATYCGNISLTE